MKKSMIVLLIVLAAAFAQKAQAVEYSSPMVVQEPWQLLRAEADEDPNALIGSTVVTQDANSDFAQKPVNAVQIKTADGLSAVGTAVGFAACAGSAADKTFTVTYWLWRPENGMAQEICSVAYTTGTQQVVKYPHSKAAATSKFWADTATVTSSWYANKIGTANNEGNNGVGVVMVVLYGEAWIYPVVSSADGATGAEAGDVSIYWFKCN